jgi:hypothetical protein
MLLPRAWPTSTTGSILVNEISFLPGPGSQLFNEQQLVSPDGTVLVSFLVGPGSHLMWEPFPGEGIVGPCYGRIRVLPDGEWQVRAYFPFGYPGPPGEIPQEALNGV